MDTCSFIHIHTAKCISSERWCECVCVCEAQTFALSMAFWGKVMRGKLYMAPCTGLQVIPGTVFKICSVSLAFSAKSANTAVRSWKGEAKGKGQDCWSHTKCNGYIHITLTRKVNISQIFHLQPTFSTVISFKKHRPEIHTHAQTNYTHALMYVSEKGGFLMEENWHLSSYQSTLLIDKVLNKRILLSMCSRSRQGCLFIRLSSS